VYDEKEGSSLCKVVRKAGASTDNDGTMASLRFGAKSSLQYFIWNISKGLQEQHKSITEHLRLSEAKEPLNNGNCTTRMWQL